MSARGGPHDPRSALVEAMARNCAVRGYLDTSVADVLAETGLSREEFDRHFDSKEACAVATENTILLELISAVSTAYEPDRSEWESVVHGVKAILELMAEKPDLAYMGYVVSRQMAPPGVKEGNEAGHRVVEAMLERGRQYSGNFRQPPTAALGVLGGAQALVRRELAAGRGARLPQLLPDCVYIATVPFLGQEEALRLTRQAQRLLAERS